MTEIDEWIERIGDHTLVISFPSNKVYSGVVVQNMHGDTLGELAADIVDANIKMWHAQEVTYDRERLQFMTKDEMLEYLTTAARLNIERNEAIDRFDAKLEAHVRSTC